MTVTNEISIDFASIGLYPRLSFMQKDTARTVKIKLFENSIPWIVPKSASAYIAFIRPDGEKVKTINTEDGEPIVTYSQNVVTVKIPAAVTADAGRLSVVVVFVDDSGTQIATFPFDVSVVTNPEDGSDEQEPITPEMFDQILSTIAVERSRINELVAMRGDANEGIYELECEGDFSATIVTNGFDAKLTVTFPSQAYIQGSRYSIATVPDALLPMCYIVHKSHENDPSTLAILEDGTILFMYNGPSVSYEEFSREIYYSLKNPFIPELADIRVAADGITYPTAGDAVRSIRTGGGGGSVVSAVLYTKQNLTPEQKAQARENIAAVDAEYVRTATQAYVDEAILGGEW